MAGLGAALQEREGGAQLSASEARREGALAESLREAQALLQAGEVKLQAAAARTNKLAMQAAAAQEQVDTAQG